MKLEAVHVENGRTARFGILVKVGKEMGDGMKSCSGEFIAMPGSDARSFMEKLKRALEAKNIPDKVKRQERLKFDCVILGERNSKAPSGGYLVDGKGTWTTTKLFFSGENEGDESEVFLNLNVPEGKAEFAEKDADYGDLVLAQLAKVL